MTPADFRGIVFGGWDALENKMQLIDFEVFYVSSIQLLPPKLPPVYFLAGTVKNVWDAGWLN